MLLPGSCNQAGALLRIVRKNPSCKRLGTAGISLAAQFRHIPVSRQLPRIPTQTARAEGLCKNTSRLEPGDFGLNVYIWDINTIQQFDRPCSVQQCPK